jgi:hypothetical protein
MCCCCGVQVEPDAVLQLRLSSQAEVKLGEVLMRVQALLLTSHRKQQQQAVAHQCLRIINASRWWPE